MFKKKLKLSEEHHILIKAMAKEFDMSFTEAGEVMLSQGFNFIRMLSENDDKILEICKMTQENEAMKKLIDKQREWWEAGQEKCNTH